jgi:alcohol dehydrogenase class IV
MGAFIGELALTRLERVISGPGKVGVLGGELDRHGRRRAVVVTGRTLGASPLLQRVTDALGDRCQMVFARAQQHVPSCTVHELAAVIEDTRADCIVSFGGGSPIDTAKAAVHSVRQRLAPESAATRDALLHIAIPTTLSAGEFTSIAGITDETTRIKRGISAPDLAPRTVITDPLVTLETPEWLWAATAMRAMDHAIESIYSVRHHPFSDALASSAIALMVRHLIPSMRAPMEQRLEERSRCQIAAWMSVFGLPSVGFGLSHAFGHQIGPRWNVPHGVTSCIILPHAMRFMAELAPGRFGPIASGLGIAVSSVCRKTAALACADRMDAFVAECGLPRRLRDVQVPQDQMNDIAATVHEAVQRSGAVDREVTCEELRALLARAY